MFLRTNKKVSVFPLRLFYLCVGQDSNLRSPKATDLQSVVIDRSTTYANEHVLHNKLKSPFCLGEIYAKYNI
jgi:hypothetical protein